MYTFRCAYRHDNGEVEGFSGFGFGEYGAKKDCLEQIRRKLSAIPGASLTVDEDGMIFSERDLTSDEMERVCRDWASGLRYGPDGSPWPGGNRGPGQSGL